MIADIVKDLREGQSLVDKGEIYQIFGRLTDRAGGFCAIGFCGDKHGIISFRHTHTTNVIDELRDEYGVDDDSDRVNAVLGEVLDRNDYRKQTFSQIADAIEAEYLL